MDALLRSYAFQDSNQYGLQFTLTPINLTDDIQIVQSEKDAHIFSNKPYSELPPWTGVFSCATHSWRKSNFSTAAVAAFFLSFWIWGEIKKKQFFSR